MKNLREGEAGGGGERHIKAGLVLVSGFSVIAIQYCFHETDKQPLVLNTVTV